MLTAMTSSPGLNAASPTSAPEVRCSRTGRAGNTFSTNVVVANDGYGDWGYSVIVGDGLIARFSPLTLSKTDLNGLRFDLSLLRLKLTGVGSRISKPNRESYDVGENTAEVNQKHVTMLLGSRVMADLGVLRLGLNGATLHSYTSTQPGGSMKGALRQDQPLYQFLMVRITDDAPKDGLGGAVVQNVQLIVNGERRPDLQPDVVRHQANSPSQVGRSFSSGSFVPSTYTRYASGRKVGFAVY